MTPCVSTSTFAEGFDPIKNLVHGVYAGWSRLTFGNANINLCYKIWCQSDIISYVTTQRSDHMGWLNAQANKFGRPLFCTSWKPATSEPASQALEVFSDMHVSWYVNGSLDEQEVKDFQYRPVSTEH